MSMELDGGYSEVWQESRRRARKEHRCRACGETIRVGDLYDYLFQVFEGDRHTSKRCVRCSELYKALVKAHGPSCDTGVAWDLDCGHDWSDVFDIPLPPEIERLAWMTPEEAQREFVKKQEQTA